VEGYESSMRGVGGREGKVEDAVTMESPGTVLENIHEWKGVA
jgi:hypothetical protein